MADVTARLCTALADRYRIERRLGEGGMATVYLAEDLKHKRKVALKVLRPELAAVLGAERFVQEITTTASLQHPHILPLFDSGQADGFLYYVMPFIDGETLREKLNRETQLGIDEAVKIATEVADALDYAHRQGVIHRDIKPENILLHDGRPMVADFGIALAVSAAAGGRMTETGLSLGTPHYMSPEQATAEKDLTSRSDIYSLGAVLYEMLTGNPPHTGSSAQQILTRIVTEEAAWVGEIRKSVPPNVASVVWQALQKTPADRFATANAFAGALADPVFRAGPRSVRGGDAARRWQRVAIATTALAALLLVGAAWGWLRPRASVSRGVTRYEIVLPRGEELAAPALTQNGLALSPDGSRFVYVGQGERGNQLWLRARDELHATALPGTDGAFNPFFSPDGSRVGFFAQGTGSILKLMVVTLSGGPPKLIAAGPEVDNGGGSWGLDGYIYIDGQLEDDGLARVPEDGGDVEPVTVPDSTRGETWHDRPYVLPNGKGVLFTSSTGRGLDENDIGVVDLTTGAHRLLVRGTHAIYAASGHLVYTTFDGTLMAAPFDQDKLSLTGNGVALRERVHLKLLGVSQFAVSHDGTFMYMADALPNAQDGLDQVVRVSRVGEILRIDSAFGGFVLDVAVSPDGSRAALTILSNGQGHVWIRHFPNGSLQKLTVAGPWNSDPAWTPDGKSVMFSSLRRGEVLPRLYVRRADGTGEAEAAGAAGRAPMHGIWSHDGQWLIYQANNAIYAMRRGVDTAPRTLITSPPHLSWPALSPNDRWLAYASDETGTPEVYVVPFPNTQSRKWLVSTGGGAAPKWAHNGRELFYRNGQGQLVAVQVSTEGVFAFHSQRVLFTFPGYEGTIPWWWWTSINNYDLAPGDQEFVMLRSSRADRSGSGLVVVENFFEELKASQH